MENWETLQNNQLQEIHQWDKYKIKLKNLRRDKKLEIVFLLFSNTCKQLKHSKKLEAEKEHKPVCKRCYKAHQVELHSAKADWKHLHKILIKGACSFACEPCINISLKHFVFQNWKYTKLSAGDIKIFNVTSFKTVRCYMKA